MNQLRDSAGITTGRLWPNSPLVQGNLTTTITMHI